MLRFFGSPYLAWDTFSKPQSLIDKAKAEVPRCLTQRQREALLFTPTPPRWCIDMHKWPYDTDRPAQQQ